MKAFQIIIIIFFIAVFFLITQFSFDKKVTYVTSNVDNRKYLVRDLPDKQKAANLLSRVRENIMKLVKYLNEHQNDKFSEYKPYIEQLSRKINTTVFSETNGSSKYTSYSVNKGDQIVFCLRSKEHKNKLHDLNLIMYVALHEIAHVATPELGHTPLFKKIFAFFTEVAISIGIYKYIPFTSDPMEYCGLTINESII